jgi:glycosyltransferase involved in cell wall biosynthesis
MDEASISVVIPVFDAPENLKAALASVAAQTLAPLEILVVDDASPIPPDIPAGAQLLRAPQNRGPAAARNLGVAAARGRFVAFLDVDDLWFPDKLAAQAAAALARPDPDACVCIAETWERWPTGDRCRPRWRPDGGPLGDYLFVRSGVMQTSSLFVARAVALAHPFDEGLRQYEDMQFLLALEAAGADFVFQDEKLFVWRRGHGGRQLSQRLHYASGRAFLEAARSGLTPKAASAFEARHFGPALLRRQPLAFVSAAFRAWRLGAVSVRGLAGAVKASLSAKIC